MVISQYYCFHFCETLVSPYRDRNLLIFSMEFRRTLLIQGIAECGTRIDLVTEHPYSVIWKMAPWTRCFSCSTEVLASISMARAEVAIYFKGRFCFDTTYWNPSSSVTGWYGTSSFGWRLRLIPRWICLSAVEPLEDTKWSRTAGKRSVVGWLRGRTGKAESNGRLWVTAIFTVESLPAVRNWIFLILANFCWTFNNLKKLYYVPRCFYPWFSCTVFF